MAEAHKVIISCAITGAVHTPSMSPYLPITPDQIAEQAIAAANAGAAIVHLHSRDPVDGRPVQDFEIYNQFLPRIRDACNVIINVTTGGPLKGASIEERMEPIAQAVPEICSLHLGSMNIGLHQLAERPREWKHEWEPEYLRNTKGLVFKNTFNEIEGMLETVYRLGITPEFECFDVGHIYTLKHFYDRGLVKKKPFIQFVTGILGGIGADIENLMFMKRVADKLFETDYLFSVVGAGRMQMPLNAVSVGLGGHVRVGLEDSLYLGQGRLATSNAEQVLRVRSILDGMSVDAATPDEARAMLGLRS